MVYFQSAVLWLWNKSDILFVSGKRFGEMKYYVYGIYK